VIRGLEFYLGGNDVFPAAVGTLDWSVSTNSTPRILAFHPALEFGITNGNPNGVWEYGWMPAVLSDLHLFTNYGTFNNEGPGWYVSSTLGPAVWLNTNTATLNSVPAGWLGVHIAGVGPAAVLRWVPRVSSTVGILGQFTAPGNAAEVSVVRSGTVVWSAVGSGSFRALLSVAAGDTIDFVASGSPESGDVALTATITQNLDPYPISLARNGSTNSVAFSALAGATYVLEQATNLKPPTAWAPLATNTFIRNETWTFQDAPQHPPVFYRVRRL